MASFGINEIMLDIRLLSFEKGHVDRMTIQVHIQHVMPECGCCYKGQKSQFQEFKFLMEISVFPPNRLFYKLLID